jgi:hypothetical protein
MFPIPPAWAANAVSASEPAASTILDMKRAMQSPLERGETTPPLFGLETIRSAELIMRTRFDDNAVRRGKRRERKGLDRFQLTRRRRPPPMTERPAPSKR